MKKLKRILCLVLAISVLTSGFVAFAESRRINPRKVQKPLDRTTENTVMLYDFNGDEEGTAPKGFASNATLTVASHEVKKDFNKKCFQITDTSHDSGYTGPTTNAPLAKTSGCISVEMRYKYVPVEPSKFASVIFAFDSGGKRVARFTIASSNGASIFCDKHSLETTRILSNSWYVLKVIFDFEENCMDALLINEATGVSKTVKNVDWYTAGTYTTLDTFALQGMSYGGTWVIDYIRQENNVERATLGDNIVKGKPQINIPSPISHSLKGRTNLTLDGKYKYTTIAPVVDGDKAFVTAKNLARILGLTYAKNGDGAVISFKDKNFAVSADKSTTVEGQLMVNVEDVAKAFGIGYVLDKENNTIVLTTKKEGAE